MSDQEWEDQALTEPYVRLEDGRCLRPVDSYSLGQDTGSLAEQSFYEDLRDQELWDLLYIDATHLEGSHLEFKFVAFRNAKNELLWETSMNRTVDLPEMKARCCR